MYKIPGCLCPLSLITFLQQGDKPKRTSRLWGRTVHVVGRTTGSVRPRRLRREIFTPAAVAHPAFIQEDTVCIGHCPYDIYLLSSGNLNCSPKLQLPSSLK